MPQFRICGAPILVLLLGCATTRQIAPIDTAVHLPAPYTQRNVKVVVQRLWMDGYGNVVGVSGTATNNGPVNLLTCNIYLNVMNVSGVKVSAAHATMIGLKSGETWDFQAMFASPFTLTFRSVMPDTIVAMNER